ncbi:hypothetical protein [Nocardia cyriacigeorgica]|uniref:hypothetical protein n=1 Tax=Nocardia cyriacigeorgica TaxID=135487 RepID=UPI001893FE83|nr:hypothetical protein [Nocardia cyriacigeorgica]MBF6457397.1 hypothetical protein [Nocardia cyriacigeorgica]
MSRRSGLRSSPSATAALEAGARSCTERLAARLDELGDEPGAHVRVFALPPDANSG